MLDARLLLLNACKVEKAVATRYITSFK